MLEAPFLTVAKHVSNWEVKGETRRGFRFIFPKSGPKSKSKPLSTHDIKSSTKESQTKRLKEQLKEMRTKPNVTAQPPLLQKVGGDTEDTVKVVDKRPPKLNVVNVPHISAKRKSRVTSKHDTEDTGSAVDKKQPQLNGVNVPHDNETLQLRPTSTHESEHTESAVDKTTPKRNGVTVTHVNATHKSRLANKLKSEDPAIGVDKITPKLIGVNVPHDDAPHTSRLANEHESEEMAICVDKKHPKRNGVNLPRVSATHLSRLTNKHKCEDIGNVVDKTPPKLNGVNVSNTSASRKLSPTCKDEISSLKMFDGVDIRKINCTFEQSRQLLSLKTRVKLKRLKAVTIEPKEDKRRRKHGAKRKYSRKEQAGPSDKHSRSVINETEERNIKRNQMVLSQNPTLIEHNDIFEFSEESISVPSSINTTKIIDRHENANDEIEKPKRVEVDNNKCQKTVEFPARKQNKRYKQIKKSYDYRRHEQLFREVTKRTRTVLNNDQTKAKSQLEKSVDMCQTETPNYKKARNIDSECNRLLTLNHIQRHLVNEPYPQNNIEQNGTDVTCNSEVETCDTRTESGKICSPVPAVIAPKILDTCPLVISANTHLELLDRYEDLFGFSEMLSEGKPKSHNNDGPLKQQDIGVLKNKSLDTDGIKKDTLVTNTANNVVPEKMKAVTRKCSQEKKGDTCDKCEQKGTDIYSDGSGSKRSDKPAQRFQSRKDKKLSQEKKKRLMTDKTNVTSELNQQNKLKISNVDVQSATETEEYPNNVTQLVETEQMTNTSVPDKDVCHAIGNSNTHDKSILSKSGKDKKSVSSKTHTKQSRQYSENVTGNHRPTYTDVPDNEQKSGKVGATIQRDCLGRNDNSFDGVELKTSQVPDVGNSGAIHKHSMSESKSICEKVKDQTVGNLTVDEEKINDTRVEPTELSISETRTDTWQMHDNTEKFREKVSCLKKKPVDGITKDIVGEIVHETHVIIEDKHLTVIKTPEENTKASERTGHMLEKRTNNNKDELLSKDIADLKGKTSASKEKKVTINDTKTKAQTNDQDISSVLQTERKDTVVSEHKLLFVEIHNSPRKTYGQEKETKGKAKGLSQNTQYNSNSVIAIGSELSKNNSHGNNINQNTGTVLDHVQLDEVSASNTTLAEVGEPELPVTKAGSHDVCKSNFSMCAETSAFGSIVPASDSPLYTSSLYSKLLDQTNKNTSTGTQESSYLQSDNIINNTDSNVSVNNLDTSCKQTVPETDRHTNRLHEKEQPSDKKTDKKKMFDRTKVDKGLVDRLKFFLSTKVAEFPVHKKQQIKSWEKEIGVTCKSSETASTKALSIKSENNHPLPKSPALAIIEDKHTKTQEVSVIALPQMSTFPQAVIKTEPLEPTILSEQFLPMSPENDSNPFDNTSDPEPLSTKSENNHSLPKSPALAIIEDKHTKTQEVSVIALPQISTFPQAVIKTEPLESTILSEQFLPMSPENDSSPFDNMSFLPQQVTVSSEIGREKNSDELDTRVQISFPFKVKEEKDDLAFDTRTSNVKKDEPTIYSEDNGSQVSATSFLSASGTSDHTDVIPKKGHTGKEKGKKNALIQTLKELSAVLQYLSDNNTPHVEKQDFTMTASRNEDSNVRVAVKAEPLSTEEPAKQCVNPVPLMAYTGQLSAKVCEKGRTNLSEKPRPISHTASYSDELPKLFDPNREADITTLEHFGLPTCVPKIEPADCDKHNQELPDKPSNNIIPEHIKQADIVVKSEFTPIEVTKIDTQSVSTEQNFFVISPFKIQKPGLLNRGFKHRKNMFDMKIGSFKRQKLFTKISYPAITQSKPLISSVETSLSTGSVPTDQSTDKKPTTPTEVSSSTLEKDQDNTQLPTGVEHIEEQIQLNQNENNAQVVVLIKKASEQSANTGEENTMPQNLTVSISESPTKPEPDSTSVSKSTSTGKNQNKNSSSKDNTKRKSSTSASNDTPILPFSEVMALKKQQYLKFKHGFAHTPFINYNEVQMKNISEPEKEDIEHRDDGNRRHRSNSAKSVDRNSRSRSKSSHRSTSPRNSSKEKNPIRRPNFRRSRFMFMSQKEPAKRRRVISKRSSSTLLIEDIEPTFAIKAPNSKSINPPVYFKRFQTPNGNFRKSGTGYFSWKRKYQWRRDNRKENLHPVELELDERAPGHVPNENQVLQRQMDACIRDYRGAFPDHSAEDLDEAKLATYFKCMAEKMEVLQMKRQTIHSFSTRGPIGTANTPLPKDAYKFRNQLMHEGRKSETLPAIHSENMDALLKQHLNKHYEDMTKQIRDEIMKELTESLFTNLKPGIRDKFDNVSFFDCPPGKQNPHEHAMNEFRVNHFFDDRFPRPEPSEPTMLNHHWRTESDRYQYPYQDDYHFSAGASHYNHHPIPRPSYIDNSHPGPSEYAKRPYQYIDHRNDGHDHNTYWRPLEESRREHNVDSSTEWNAFRRKASESFRTKDRLQRPYHERESPKHSFDRSESIELLKDNTSDRDGIKTCEKREAQDDVVVENVTNAIRSIREYGEKKESEHPPLRKRKFTEVPTRQGDKIDKYEKRDKYECRKYSNKFDDRSSEERDEDKSRSKHFKEYNDKPYEYRPSYKTHDVYFPSKYKEGFEFFRGRGRGSFNLRGPRGDYQYHRGCTAFRSRSYRKKFPSTFLNHKMFDRDKERGESDRHGKYDSVKKTGYKPGIYSQRHEYEVHRRSDRPPSRSEHSNYRDMSNNTGKGRYMATIKKEPDDYNDSTASPKAIPTVCSAR